MAKATITIEDDEDGFVNVSCEFDPPTGREESPAQRAAVKVLAAMTRGNSVEHSSTEYADDFEDEEEVY